MSDQRDLDKSQTEQTNTKQQQPPKRNQLVELFEQLNAIPWASFWSLSLSVGGLLLLSYFLSIEYLPDLDVSAISVTVAGVAAVGTFLVLMIGFGLTLPMLYVDATDDKKKKMYLLAQATVGIVLGFGVIANLSYDFGKEIWAWPVLLLLFVVLSAITTERFTWFNWLKNVGKEALWGFWAITVPMLYYELLTSKGDKDWEDILNLLLFTFAFAVISIMVAYAPAKRRAVARFIAVIGAVLLLSVAVQRPTLVSQASVAVLGLSQRNPVTLILSESGCNSANLLLVEKPCAFDRGAKLGSLDGVRVVSRIGSQFVVHWQPKDASNIDSNGHGINDDNQVWRRVILKKDDVVSWAYDFGKKKPTVTKGDAPKL
ncbi:hypothetical protein AZSI13_16500 [Azospira sp. I13]|uniref:hypothetical protein n=1 Tax=Azospira sp. I13 TaxID=1765050 RepID=UPI000D4C1829|nr:hypothetical protein [Azospira sp. I13]GBG02323.1 hypothetical protein AZSI13_16500 [Azospira sp. I13]